MSVYGMRHTSVLPAGHSWPGSIASDSWEDRTVILPALAVELAIEAKCRKPVPPAWACPGSGVARPSEAHVRRLARVACSYRLQARREYAKAWLTFCLTGGLEAPCHLAHGLKSMDAERIRRRFAELDVFDPRDFTPGPAVPF